MGEGGIVTILPLSISLANYRRNYVIDNRLHFEHIQRTLPLEQ